MSHKILPPATIGIIGGGQLGMMLIREAQRMGYRSIVLDPDPQCPASRLADETITAPFEDIDAADKLAQRASVITYEFESINPDVVERIEQTKPVYPGSGILRVAQNRRLEKEELSRRGFPVVRFRIARTSAEIAAAIESLGYPVVLKTSTGGYDGKGQAVIRDRSEADRFLAAVKLAASEYVVEEFLELEREISVLVARTKEGAIVAFPPSENAHRENILHTTFVPARLPESVQDEAKKLACSIIESFQMVGLLCVEMFVTTGGKVVVNELAPRPHNSGHYSLDACTISQFEMLLRTICGLQVSAPTLLTPCAMINILGKHLTRLDLDKLFHISGVKLHLYGKTRVEPRRKMGHVTILKRTQSEVEEAVTVIEEMIGEERSPAAKVV